MPARDILQLGNPILLEICTPVDDVTSAETQAVIRDLEDTLADILPRVIG